MADLANLRISVDSRGVRSATNDLNALGSVAATTEGATSRLNSVFTKTNAVLASLGIAIGQALVMAREFEKSMAEVSTLVDTSVVSMQELTTAAREQSKAFGGDVQTQAKALYQIISAGASTAAEANDILTTANKLAVGGITDVATAADGLTSVLNAYGDQVGGAAEVSDAMFVAMRAGKTTIGELSASLGAVAPLAAQMGVSFDELTAATAALTKGGVSTSVAMTGIRAILAAVAKPSDEAAKLAAKLGIEFNTAAIQSKGLASFMEELRVKTSGSQDAMAQLFGGVEALVPALALAGTAGEDLNAIIEQMGAKAGSTDAAVDKMSKTFDVQFNRAVASVNDLLLSFGLALQSAVLPALQLFNNNISAITTVLGALTAAIAAYAAMQLLAAARTALVTSQFAIQAAAAISSAGAIGGLASAQMILASTATAAAGAARGLMLVLVANPFTAVAVAVGVLTAAFLSMRNAQAEARAETNNLITSLKSLAAARSADYVARRDEQMISMLTKQGELTRLQKTLSEQTGVSAGYAAQALVPKIKILREEINALGKGIEESDALFKANAEAARSMAPPVVQAGKAMAGTAKEAAAAVKELSEAEKQKKQLTEQTDELIKSLNREIEAIGKTEKEMRALEITRALEVAQTEEQKKKILELAAAREAALVSLKASELAKEAADAEKGIGKLNKELAHQISLIGMTADERFAATLAFEEEAIVAEYAEKGITRGNEALEEYLRLRRELATGENAFAKEAEATQRLANNLEAAAGMLGQGRLGAVVQNVLKMEIQVDDGEFRKISEVLGKELDKVAKGFSKIFSQALAGAQIGQQVNGLMRGLGVKSSNTGSQIGGAIGGAFGGPIGAIGGAIVGGLVGGMLKKTPKASATIEVAGGNALMAGVSGSKKLQEVATGLANGLIKGLGDIAGALGGELGGAVRLSIGQRKDKFTVDLSGQGRTKGVPTFNTEAEAIAFAMRHAITQGAITGISAGAQALLRAGGDLNAQLQKALTFDKVFDDLRRELDPAGAALDDLAREMEKLKAIFAEAGASAADYAKLEELFAIRQAKALFDANRPRRELEIQLMEAQGNAAGALAARRKLELESMDANLRGLQEQIFAAEDANKAAEAQIEATKRATEAAEEAAEAAKRLADDRRSLEIDLMDALGNSAEALAARRRMELEAMDESLRGLQEQIWAALDARDAAAAAAEAAKVLAEEQARAAEEAARVAADRQRLEIDLLEALGFSSEALAARRQLELAAMDESLRALQGQIWAALDARAAAEAAAEATRVLAEEQARAAEVAASLAAQRRELEIQLLEAQGFALEALTARRAMELDATDASLRSLREAIFVAQDRAAAEAAAVRAAEEAAAAEARAAQDAANAMQQYMDTLTDVTKTVTDEINRLRGINASSSSVLLKAQFATLTAQARNGNLDALGKLPELSRAIEEATIGSASSALEVARIRAWLSASLSETLGAQSASNAQMNTTGAGLIFDGNETTTANTAQTADAISNMRGDLYNALYQIAKNTGKSYELMDRWDGDGLPDIREDASDYY